MLGDARLYAEFVASKYMKLNQIISGFWYCISHLGQVAIYFSSSFLIRCFSVSFFIFSKK
jgi:hypothetical protein